MDNSIYLPDWFDGTYARWFELEDLPGEEWRNISGYEGCYQISNLGRVKSLERLVQHKQGHRKIVSKILKPFVNKGYYEVDLCKEGTQYNRSIHRLVAQAFLSDYDKCLSVDHINSNTCDNRSVNLQMLSLKDNSIKWWTSDQDSSARMIAHSKQTQSVRKVTSSVKYREKMSDIKKQFYMVEENRRKQSDRMKEVSMNLEVKEKRRIALQGRVWVNDGSHQKLIKLIELQSYLDSGYTKGALTHRVRKSSYVKLVLANGVEHEFVTLPDACMFLNKNKCYISDCIYRGHPILDACGEPVQLYTRKSKNDSWYKYVSTCSRKTIRKNQIE